MYNLIPIKTPADINGFMERWIHNNLPGDKYYSIDFFVSQILNTYTGKYLQVILTDDHSLLRRIPPSTERHVFNSIPFVIYCPEYQINESISKLKCLRAANSFFLFVQRVTEKAEDVISRAAAFAQIMVKHGLFMQYIIVSRREASPLKHNPVPVGTSSFMVTIFSTHELSEKVKSLKDIIDYERASSKTVPLCRFGAPSLQPLWIIRPKRPKGDGVFDFVQYMLMDNTMPFQSDVYGRILHFYGTSQSNFLRERVEYLRKFLKLAPIKTAAEKIIWSDGQLVLNKEYIGLALDAKQLNNDDTCVKFLQSEMRTAVPQLLIIDFPFAISPISPIGRFIAAARQNCTVWICCRNHLYKNWSPDVIVSVSQENREDNLKLFIAEIKQFTRSDLPLKIRYNPTTGLPTVKSKYYDYIPKIKYCSTSGMKEVDIARALNITIHVLRQIKRQFGIRVNAPLQRKRRTGLSKNIFLLHEQGVNVEDIAKQLHVSAYYVRKYLPGEQSQIIPSQR